MAMAIAKPSFGDFIRTCTPLLKIPELEQLMRERVRGIVAELLNFESDTDPAQRLKQFLQKDENFRHCSEPTDDKPRNRTFLAFLSGKSDFTQDLTDSVSFAPVLVEKPLHKARQLYSQIACSYASVCLLHCQILPYIPISLT